MNFRHHMSVLSGVILSFLNILKVTERKKLHVLPENITTLTSRRWW